MYITYLKNMYIYIIYIRVYVYVEYDIFYTNVLSISVNEREMVHAHIDVSKV